MLDGRKIAPVIPWLIILYSQHRDSRCNMESIGCMLPFAIHICANAWLFSFNLTSLNFKRFNGVVTSPKDIRATILVFIRGRKPSWCQWPTIVIGETNSWIALWTDDMEGAQIRSIDWYALKGNFWAHTSWKQDSTHAPQQYNPFLKNPGFHPSCSMEFLSQTCLHK